MEELLKQLRQHGITDQAVLAAIRATPRELFVAKKLAHLAYNNVALPIGDHQTISQPYIVARMTELLSLAADSSVLEIGTGSGYQTAILARLTQKVYSVERIENLLHQAQERFQQLDLRNIITRHADGSHGWPEYAPFDAIIVTAAAATMPLALLRQLADGGRMVLPLGQGEQFLLRIQRRGDKFSEERLNAVRFVPLVSGELL